MTTIVYDHKARQIAVDGRTTAGGLICTEKAEKWIRDGNDWWFLCGSVCDRERMIEYIKDGNMEPPRWKIECSGFLVSKGKVYQCLVTDDGEPCKSEIHYSDSMGSGSQFALAAIDHGKTAKQAIKYAMTRDNGTGGKVSVFDVDKMEFVK